VWHFGYSLDIHSTLWTTCG